MSHLLLLLYQITLIQEQCQPPILSLQIILPFNQCIVVRRQLKLAPMSVAKINCVIASCIVWITRGVEYPDITPAWE